MPRLPWKAQDSLIDEPLEDLLPDVQKVLAQIQPVFTTIKALDEKYAHREELLSGIKKLVAVLVQATSDGAEVVNAYDSDNEGREQLRHMIMTCSELQERMSSLLSSVIELRESQAQLKTTFSSLGFSSRLPKHKDAILIDMTEKLNQALADLEGQGSLSLRQIFEQARDVKQRIEQYRIAEDSAQFIEQVVLQTGSYAALEERTDEMLVSNTVPEHLFSEIDDWLSGQKRVYCLFGGAGTGKTPFAYRLCVRLQSGQQAGAALGASFFFAYEDQYLESLRFFLPAIAYTLQPPLRSEIVATVREYLNEGGQEQERAAAEQILRKALDAGPPSVSVSDHRRTVLVIDGIDKCKDTEEVPGLLRYLFGLVRTFPWLYLFITSRPRPIVMSALTDSSFAGILHRYYLDDGLAKWQGDAKRYLESIIQDIPACHAFLLDRPSTLPRLLKYARGDFAFTRVLTSFLEMTNDDFDVHMKSILAPFARQDVLYRCILQSASSRLSSSLLSTSVTLLQFVAFGGDVFAANRNIFYGRRFSPDDLAQITDCLRPVLAINSDAEIVLLHPPFREFLLNRNRCLDRFHVDFHANFTATALAVFLNANLVTDIFAPCQEPLPGVAGPSLRHPLLTLWPRYLSNAKCNEHLVDQLVRFVPSPQLCAYAWVTTSAEAMRAGEAFVRATKQMSRQRKRFSTELADMERTCTEYFVFVAYVQLWRDRFRKPDTASIDLPGFSDTDVIRRIGESCTDTAVGLHVAHPAETGGRSAREDDPFALDLRLRDAKSDAKPDLTISTQLRTYDFLQYSTIIMDFRRALKACPSFMDPEIFADVKSGAYRIEDWT